MLTMLLNYMRPLIEPICAVFMAFGMIYAAVLHSTSQDIDDLWYPESIIFLMVLCTIETYSLGPIIDRSFYTSEVISCDYLGWDKG